MFGFLKALYLSTRLRSELAQSWSVGKNAELIEQLLRDLAALGERGLAGISLVFESGRDNARFVRFAVHLLERVPSPRVMAILAAGLRAEPKSGESETIARALAQYGPPAVPTLVDALESGWLCRTIIYHLGQLKDRRAVNPLLKILARNDSASSHLHQSVVSALGTLRDPRANSALIALLQPASTELARAATLALRAIGSEESVPALTRYDEERKAWEKSLVTISCIGSGCDASISVEPTDPVVARRSNWKCGICSDTFSNS